MHDLLFVCMNGLSAKVPAGRAARMSCSATMVCGSILLVVVQCFLSPVCMAEARVDMSFKVSSFEFQVSQVSTQRRREWVPREMPSSRRQSLIRHV